MAVEYSSEGSVGYITLDNPPANSYDLSFMEELSECVRAAAEDEAAGAVILRSGSERFFSAGADIKAFDANTVEENMAMIRRAHEGLSEIARTPKVLIAQIGATALGGGIERPLDEGLETERALVEPLFESEDAREGLSAFMEKRKPEFSR